MLKATLSAPSWYLSTKSAYRSTSPSRTAWMISTSLPAMASGSITPRTLTVVLRGCRVACRRHEGLRYLRGHLVRPVAPDRCGGAHRPARPRRGLHLCRSRARPGPYALRHADHEHLLGGRTGPPYDHGRLPVDPGCPPSDHG